jgi:hypothetical protein
LSIELGFAGIVAVDQSEHSVSLLHEHILRFDVAVDEDRRILQLSGVPASLAALQCGEQRHQKSECFPGDETPVLTNTVFQRLAWLSVTVRPVPGDECRLFRTKRSPYVDKVESSRDVRRNHARFHEDRIPAIP